MVLAIGQDLVFAVGIALSPFAIVGVVLMLSTPRAQANGPAFVAGWMAGLALMGALILLIAGGAGADEGVADADWVDALKLALGLGLLWLGLRKVRRRSGGEELPAWMRAVDDFTPGRAAATGAGLAALNPKNLVLIAAGATTIAETGIGAGQQAVSLLVFVAIGTIGAAAPVVLYLALRERSREPLERLRAWMIEHNGAVVAVLCLLIGAKLIGDAISGFSA